MTDIVVGTIRKPRQARLSRSVRAGLTFPVGRISRLLKKRGTQARVGGGAPVYLAAVLEYLVNELLELAGNSAKDRKRVRILPRDIQLAVRSDAELNQLLGEVDIPESGVLPLVHPLLVKDQKQKQKSTLAKKKPTSIKSIKKPRLVNRR